MSHKRVTVALLIMAGISGLIACSALQDDATPKQQREETAHREYRQPVRADIETLDALRDPSMPEPVDVQTLNGAGTVSTAPAPPRSRIAMNAERASFGNDGLANIRAPSEPLNRENYAHVTDNPVKLAIEQPVSTFSIDVDTGAYANVRRFLNRGTLPPEDAVRIEELVNYFAYDYPLPGDSDAPFSVVTELSTAPWNRANYLLHIGLRGFEIPAAARAPANLVFLLDVSGSMRDANKLPLLKSAFSLLTGSLGSRDRVAIVVYAGATGVVLEPVAGDQEAQILAAIRSLSAGGRTNGASGIRLAYETARQGYVEGGINRVILATDGDFNVGTVNFEALVDLVERNRETGVSLTTLGFGTGNYNDHLMERLADAGNGNYAYIDNLNEARKVLVDELTATLQTIARDVKIQVEFNPGQVAEYRLIGYENRILRREDFNNDRIDAGEIGAGHSVTALYELTLTDSASRRVDPLRYRDAYPAPDAHPELAFLKLRYKAPQGGDSRLLTRPILRDQALPLNATSASFRFSAAVAAFGQKLRGGDYLGDFSFADVSELAGTARGVDGFGYREEFLTLVQLADSLSGGDLNMISNLRRE